MNDTLYFRGTVKLIGTVLFFSLFFNSCIPPEPPLQKEHIYKVTKLAVTPFLDMSELFGEGAHVKCPLCEKHCIPERIPEAIEAELTNQLIELLKNRGGCQLIYPSQMEDVVSEHARSSKKNLADKNILLKIGNQLGADAVIAGHVYRFRERIGNDFAVDSPASVGIDLHLILLSSGKVVWSRRFDETQQPLHENLLQLGDFLKRNMKWVTARELAASGLEDAVREMPIQ